MPAEQGLPLPLAEAVISLMAFLELSDDDTIDPDSAVTAMESASADLQRLTRPEREVLAAHAQELATRESEPRMVAFLSGFPEAVGLLDED